jgi:dimethylargininase
MPIAITRQVSPNIGLCELTHLARQAIDVDRARAQHRRYEETLAALGCEILQLPAEPDLPDSVFVEDTAVVLDEVAIIARPGTESRRPETAAVAKALTSYRGLVYIDPPGTLEGGDVLRIDRTLYVGLTNRSNPAGHDQLRALLQPFAYTVVSVPVDGCLHLKSAVTQVSADTLLINRSWVDAGAFGSRRFVDVHPEEPSAANALLLGGTVMYPAAFPHTWRRLEEEGIPVRSIDVSELGKAEGGVTCCSLILSVP